MALSYANDAILLDEVLAQRNAASDQLICIIVAGVGVREVWISGENNVDDDVVVRVAEVAAVVDGRDDVGLVDRRTGDPV